MQGSLTIADILAGIASLFVAFGGFQGLKKLIKGAGSLLEVSNNIQEIKKEMREVCKTLEDHSVVMAELQKKNVNVSYLEERIRHLDGQMWAVMNAADYGVWISDTNGMCISCNDALTTIMMCERDEIIGNAWIDIIHPDDRISVTSRWAEFVRGDRIVFQADYRFKSPQTGEITHVHGVAIRPFVQGVRSLNIFGWAKLKPSPHIISPEYKGN